jgi:AraC family transcriptional regulator
MSNNDQMAGGHFCNGSAASQERGMTPTAKALWFIESHLASDFTLDDIASVAGVSRYHLVRGFAAATGMPVMRYARARRLSVAAQSLGKGAADILSVALDARYGSHEAFTRAFREQFGQTPEAIRAKPHLANLRLQEPLRMEKDASTTLGAPRFETYSSLLVAGIGERCRMGHLANIPGLWQRLGLHLGSIPNEVRGVCYGVSYNHDEDEGFDYLAGVEVTDFSDLSGEFSRIRLGKQRYAVFAHREHVSLIGRTINAIWNDWLPKSGHKPADKPIFERYDTAFDARTGQGGCEIWIPLKT